jgi:uracil-DNA glycosylase
LKQELEELAVRASTCTLCRLSAGRTQVVFASGDPDADLMFIGEGPGYHEDKQGLPFVGAAGQLLNRLLADIGLDRDRVYVCNILKCRPPGNRDPLPDEVETCTPYLMEQVRLVDPRVIVTLGNFATRFILGRPTAISRVRGQRHVVDGRVVIPTFHPAAILRGGGDSSRQMESVRADFAEVRAALDEPLETVASAPEEQLGLF